MKRTEISVKSTARGLTAAVLALLIGSALASGSLAAGAPSTGSKTGSGSSQPPALRNGHALWATVDVCSSKPSPLVGIRGSMPPDGRPSETMYMSFRVQYMDTKTGQWTNLSKGGQSGPVKIGPASATRQAGRTFELASPPHGGSFLLRGLVEFQWRAAAKLTLSATRLTSSGHPSAAGAVPHGFSAATCTIR
jgi:hypothetical protein